MRPRIPAPMPAPAASANVATAIKAPAMLIRMGTSIGPIVTVASRTPFMARKALAAPPAELPD